ncbi:hypothetical protein CP965_09845 [Halarcobacter mediterraneus]|uniref:Uncharacterized protein n=1 Tax=Halarcobacter mediterraneus TaxID=2023153 RepID=A0A4Q1AR89_9BACT|nr:hypothetical protein [Halarcobacter mediterraneus]RXK12074.1 hypothetical protein CP965_09845 [Halarcobacter mediterraneus]
MKKQIVIGGFSKEQREKELRKVKKKYLKRGYKFINYVDNGTLKSFAIFEVEDSIIKKEKATNLILLGIFFMALACIMYFKAS